MSRRPPSARILGGHLITFAAVLATSCGPGSQPPRRDLVPDPEFARRALQQALDEWRRSPESSMTANGRSLIFVDQQRRPGQKLREYTILGDSVVDNCRKYVVRLSLAEPDETLLAAYYVFDRMPVWVYRVEDFDMMMHMAMAPDDAPSPAGASDAKTGHAGHRGPGNDSRKASD